MIQMRMRDQDRGKRPARQCIHKGRTVEGQIWARIDHHSPDRTVQQVTVGSRTRHGRRVIRLQA